MLKPNKVHQIVITLLLLMISHHAWAQPLTLSHAILRLPPPIVGGSAAVYLDIHNNNDKDITITAVNSSIANNTMMHGMRKKNGMMHMFTIKKLIIPALTTVQFSQGQQHIMLMGLKCQLILGEKVSIELTFGSGKKQSFLATVTDLR